MRNLAFGIQPALENRYTATPFFEQLTYTPQRGWGGMLLSEGLVEL